MKIKTLALGPLEANCYIVQLEEINIIIDPGAQPDAIIDYLDSRSLVPDFIINTHGHFDHIEAVSGLIEKYNIPFYIDSAEENLIADPDKNGSSFFGENNLSLKTYNLINAKDQQYFNKNGIDIIRTPGHSPGSITIKIEDCLFTGDLLFKGSIGRTDLAGGDTGQIKDSLLKIKNMDRNYLIYPGHGPATELKYEIENNYYLGNGFIHS
jgi:hydroxyacylglutathione hydrolase